MNYIDSKFVPWKLSLKYFNIKQLVLAVLVVFFFLGENMFPPMLFIPIKLIIYDLIFYFLFFQISPVKAEFNTSG